MPAITLTTLQGLKQKGEKITMLTCYDATFAHACNEAGVEVLLVGDSLGMVLQGHDSTLPVTTAEMAYHVAAVKRGNTDALILADLPFGRFGLSICYDLRFASLYRALAAAGAELIAIPAAFTKQTGEAHWHVLTRARAIETGAFVLAATQGGLHENGRSTFGHSIVVSPWGEVLAEAGEEPGVIFADIDLAASEEARARIPAIKHGREFEIEIAGEAVERARRDAS